MTTARHLRPPQLSDATRRCFDIVVSATALLLLSPLIVVISTLIVLETGWPILFAQTRLGRDCHPFKMLKFRKFGSNCGSSGSALTLEGDARMTTVGRFLQASKLDELPQFLNVLRGSMSIVGPRPETLVFADCFQGEFRRILDYKPGLLGPSQVMFRSESQYFSLTTDPEQLYRTYLFPLKAHIDLEYYRRRTLLGDIGWILRGAAAILRGSKAGGTSCRTTTMAKTKTLEGRLIDAP